MSDWNYLCAQEVSYLPCCFESTKSMKSVAKYKFKTRSKYLLQICKVQVSDTLKLSISENWTKNTGMKGC